MIDKLIYRFRYRSYFTTENKIGNVLGGQSSSEFSFFELQQNVKSDVSFNSFLGF